MENEGEKSGEKMIFGCLGNRRKGMDFDGLGVFSPVLPKINPLYLVGKHKKYLFQSHSQSIFMASSSFLHVFFKASSQVFIQTQAVILASTLSLWKGVRNILAQK